VDYELDRFKRIDLCAYAGSRGYRLVRREITRSGGSRGSTASSLMMRHPVTDDKIVARVDCDGHWTYFSIRDARDNGTIIDFVLRRGANTLARVRDELRVWAGDVRAVRAPAPACISAKAHDHERAMVRQTFARATVVSNHPYLNSRGIRPETLHSFRFAGTWRVDDRGDLLFPHREGDGLDSVCGFERKNAHFAGFSAGGTKALWVSNYREDDDKLVITEAVIDAFSYHQLQADQRARYASTCGSFGERQARHVAAAIGRLPRGSTVVIATDGDLAGDKLAERIGRLAGEAPTVRHRAPLGKDWNECLRRQERDYIKSLGLGGQGRSR
jgi:hypothetical protein